MEPRRVVVLGGGYAGVLAAIRTKKRGGRNVEVVLVSDRDVFVERIRLHERAVHGRVVEHSIAGLLRGTGVVLRLAMVTSIEPAKKRVQLTDGDLAYDKLIVAVGSATDVASAPLGAREYAHTLDPRATERLHAAIEAAAKKPDGRVVVGGAGLTGVEIAAEIKEKYPKLDVTLVTASELAPMQAPRARLAMRAALGELGVRILENADVQAIEEGAVITTERLPFDVCIWTAGMKATPLAARAGFAVNARGQALIDPCLHPVGHRDVYVVGDAAAFVVDPGMPVVMGCKTAMPMAAQAADNALASLRGREETPFDFRDTGYCISIGRRRAVIQVGQGKRVITGWLGVFIKESICRFTLRVLRWERLFLFTYSWLRTGRAPRALPAAPLAREAA